MYIAKDDLAKDEERVGEATNTETIDTEQTKANGTAVAGRSNTHVAS